MDTDPLPWFGRSQKAGSTPQTSISTTGSLVPKVASAARHRDSGSKDAPLKAKTSVLNVRTLLPEVRRQPMEWITAGCSAVVGLLVIRVLLHQVRALLMDVGAVVRAWRELLSVVRNSGPPTRSGGS